MRELKSSEVLLKMAKTPKPLYVTLILRMAIQGALVETEVPVDITIHLFAETKLAKVKIVKRCIFYHRSKKPLPP